MQTFYRNLTLSLTEDESVLHKLRSNWLCLFAAWTQQQKQQMHFSISLKFKPRGKEQSPALFSSYDISLYYIFRHRAAALEWRDGTED